MNDVKEWWMKPVRMLRVDYAPDFSSVKEEDMETLARSRKEDWQINCEWIVGAPGFVGDAYRTTFKASGYETYPGLEGFDYLRKYTPFAHKYGIRVLSYLNMHWYAYDFAEQHPDWEQLLSTGHSYGRMHPLYGNGTTFCVNSSWRDWAFDLIREAMKTGIDGVFLDGPVVFPDSCYCLSCREKFRAEYGREIPKEDWKDPLWKNYLGFRENSLAQFLSDAQNAVRDINPEGIIFLNAGSWGPSGWRVARDIQKTGPFQSFNGAEAFFHYGSKQNIYASLMTGKYLRAGDNPPVVFTHYMNGKWHYLNLPPGEVQLALAQTAMAGANPWLGLINSSLESQPEANKPVKEIFTFLEAEKEFFTATESFAEVGLLFSACTCRNYLSRLEGFYERPGSGKEENLIVDQKSDKVKNWAARKIQCEEFLSSAYAGYFHALTRAHIPFDILLDQSLKDIARYKTVILPDGVCLNKEAVAILREYVSAGGNLLASFEAGFYDERGDYNESLFDLLGLEEIDDLFPVVVGENYLLAKEEHLQFGKGKLMERGPYALKVKAKDDTRTPAFFLNQMNTVYTPLKGLSSYPSLVLNNYGAGRTAYFPEAIGHFMRETAMVSAAERIIRMVKELNGISIIETDAPKTVAVEIYKQTEPDRLIIHLVNNTVDGRPINEFLPIRDITLKLNIGHKPGNVFPLRENDDLSYSFDVALHIHIPCLKLYEVIVVEL
ncbi:MAG: beta-galactosidase trimerization domain-containing protein [bacterium]|nr:beta-galactosidase trimerization domain-containing protein [bacterium]